MGKERVILHCDLNNFYASVECRYDPRLREVPMAVGGSEENRHGIVLAKNELAKQFGIKTAETLWQARQKCPELVVVPPHYERYYEVSRAARAIYARYTDRIEPFGIDECWLDMTGSTLLFGSGREIAERLRREVREELGVTISVGVSFNKVFAKLGSDLKKPDAVSEIPPDRFREIVWGLSAREMIGVGDSTAQRLESMGVYTIGQLARFDRKLLGKKAGQARRCPVAVRQRGGPLAGGSGKRRRGSEERGQLGDLSPGSADCWGSLVGAAAGGGVSLPAAAGKAALCRTGDGHHQG